MVDFRTKLKSIPDFDKWLVQHEGAGILTWMVQGYLDYQANGLVDPDCVIRETESYRADSDELGDFLSQCCIEETHSSVSGGKLYELYVNNAGETPMSKNAFGKALGDRFKKVKSGGLIRYKGIRLLAEGEGNSAGGDDPNDCSYVHKGMPRDTKYIRDKNHYANKEPAQKVSPRIPTPQNTTDFSYGSEVEI